ncbi:MAG: hypothetical protein R3C14_38725 [Caldilineaceae bacterium]
MYHRNVFRLGLFILILLLSMGCGQKPAATAPPPTPTAPATATTAPTVTPTPMPTTPAPATPTETPTVIFTAIPTVIPTATPQLEKETIHYSGALSVEDLNALILELQAVPGVATVQGGMQDIEIAYDPHQVDRAKIIAVIQSHGYSVEQ